MREFANRVLNAGMHKTFLFSVGQAGYIIKSRSGQLLGIDLYLSECVERIEGHIGFKRLLPRILSPFELELDIIIATHSHVDHFDIDSIPELMANGRTQMFASVNCEKEVKHLMMTEERITYVCAGVKRELGDFTMEFVNCDHGSSAPDAVGVIISVDCKKIYMAGDTCLRLDRIEEINSKGEIDVMIAPINGAFGNMNENECAVLSGTLKPKLTIPSHYGMFASHGGNPGLFVEIMNKNYPNQKYMLLALGEGIAL